MFSIDITDAAANELSKYLVNDDQGVRLGVLPGGCAGFKYDIAVEQGHSEDDLVLEENSIKLFIDGFSAGYLDGLRVDYVTTMLESGFKFNNPNASGGCGCGTSFTA